ncbi:host attachment protein [Candidatus Uhrbacteria bacterium]|nr:host attachment protein [Candidatus Uhrbacteria bacterium]
MNLPEHLQKFSHATLIVVGNHVHAKFFLAQGEELNQVGEIEHPREMKSDNESQLGSEPKTEQERLKKFAKEIAEKIEQEKGAHIYLTMKKELMHPVEEHLPKQTTELINRRLDADLMKEDIFDVVDRLLKAWK